MVFFCALKQQRQEVGRALHRFRRALAGVDYSRIPERLLSRIPEGFLHYGVYPEMYARAAREFLKEDCPEAAVVGIRSIGTSLSSMISAALEDAGCEIWSFTVRPRGHPFDRWAAVSEILKRKIHSLRNKKFLIVDEGPGLSGSSFFAVIDMLESIGVHKKNIILFPSHETDAGTLLSEEAANRWTSYKKYISSFESSAVTGFSIADCVDISAGAWRKFCFTSAKNENKKPFPPINPAHEQMKYISAGSSGEKVFHKFIGLGNYGKDRYEKAMALSNGGFYPGVKKFEHGFLKRAFVRGEALSKFKISSGFLDFAAGYFAFTKQNFPEENGATFEENMAMVRENVSGLIGPGMLKAADAIQKKFSPFFKSPEKTFKIDGRVFPHEWLRTRDGYMKTDCEGHYCDQFFPRCQQMGWDLAAFIIEFGLQFGPNNGARRFFLDSYRKRSKDHDLQVKIAFYEIAYLSYRMAYCELSAVGSGVSAEGVSFRKAAAAYRRLLMKALGSFK